MHKTVVLNVVGLTPSLIGDDTPNLKAFRDAGKAASVRPALPAVTTTAQANYLTGATPREHGIVGNGWYFRETAEVRLWQQADALVQRPRVWDEGRRRDAAFTCANLFWWYAMYCGADYAVTPRPMYPADGRKIPDVWTHPASLRHELQAELGQFPLFKFWGPVAGIAASDWIGRCAVRVDERFDPTLTLVYLPHLDYVLQKVGPGGGARRPGASAPASGDVGTGSRGEDERRDTPIGTPERKLRVGVGIENDPDAMDQVSDARSEASASESLPEAVRRELRAIDAVVGRLIDHFAARGARVMILSEYGIAPVDKPVHVNRVLRDAGYIALRRELGTERLDAAASRAFAVADHQVAHIYVRDADDVAGVQALLARTPGVGRVLAGGDRGELDHPRAGELVCLAEPGCWFTYYYWLDDALAPDYARTVDIHRKPGYDPVELFLAPRAKPRLLAKLAGRKLGFRNLLDVIPLDATLVRGSHGLPDVAPDAGPLVMSNHALPAESLASTDVHGVILDHIFA